MPMLPPRLSCITMSGSPLPLITCIRDFVWTMWPSPYSSSLSVLDSCICLTLTAAQTQQAHLHSIATDGVGGRG